MAKKLLFNSKTRRSVFIGLDNSCWHLFLLPLLPRISFILGTSIGWPVILCKILHGYLKKEVFSFPLTNSKGVVATKIYALVHSFQLSVNCVCNMITATEHLVGHLSTWLFRPEARWCCCQPLTTNSLQVQWPLCLSLLIKVLQLHKHSSALKLWPYA